MEAIVIPDFEDEEEELVLPTFGRAAFGSTSSAGSTPEFEPYNHRAQQSQDYPSRLNPNLPRPGLPKGAASFQPGSDDRPKLVKLSNGSSSSLVTPGTSISSSAGFLANRKGSFASIKNAFKSGAAGPAPPVPPLKNPFSSSHQPSSPTAASFQRGAKGSAPPAPSAYHHRGDRKQSIATNHSSQWSQGGRSNASQGSSNFKAEDHPVPALPPIPMRGTPSRTGRLGSDASLSMRRQGSISEEYEGKAPLDEALRVIFNTFRDAANGKIARVCGRPLNTQPSLPAYLEAGADALFDANIVSLAQCGKRHVRRIVDMLNGWCRGHCEGIGATEVRMHLNQSLGLQMRVEDAATILGGRKTSASKYITNRVLIELIKMTPKEALGEDLGMTLESNAFNAYRTERLEEHTQFPHRKAVSNLQIELLGYLSDTRFLTVSDRFIRELSRYAAAPTKETEAKIEHLLKGMRRLKLKVYPEEELEMSSEFIQAIAGFFANTHGQYLKYAYAETLIHLLHPVIETATAEVNHPMWSKAIVVILQRASGMLAKPRYWSIGFSLFVVTLGVSPREVFMQNWQICMDNVQRGFKDRACRAVAMGAFVRLLWIYLNRCTESSTSMRKRLDPLIRSFLSTSNLSPPDLSLEPYVAILHYIMTRHLDYGEEFVTEYLSQPSSSRVGETASMTLPPPERATVVVRASNCTLRSIEQERPASFPHDPDFARLYFEGFETSGDMLDTSPKQEVTDFLTILGPVLINLLIACDRQIGTLLLSSEAVSVSGSASSNTMETPDSVTLKHGDVYVSYSARCQPFFHLFRSMFDALPRCMPSEIGFATIGNILSRGTFCADPEVCIAAGNAMRRIAQDPSKCLLLVNTYRDFVFETRHIFKDTFLGSRLLESQFERVITLWVDMLQLLVNHERVAQAQSSDDDQVALPITPSFLDKLDAAAVFLLCSNSLALRRLAGKILSAARDLEGNSRKPSAAFRYSRLSPEKSALTRVIQLMEGAVEEADIATLKTLPWASASDRTRLDVHIADKDKLLRRIAESDNPKDGALWLAVLPSFISKMRSLLRGPTTEMRSLVVAMVLRLQGHIMSTGSISAGRATAGMRANVGNGRTTTDTAALADYWRAYLCVLCVTMPDPGINPMTTPVQRTKEAVILTPDTISSPALFHYLAAQLTWEDPRFRDAAVYSLGSISKNALRPLSEILTNIIRRLADGAKSIGRKQNIQGPIWTALAHVFRLISPLIADSKSTAHLANLSSMIGFVKMTWTLLSDPNVKEDYDLQSLRRSFCIVVENLTDSLVKFDSSDRFLGEEMRGAIFKLCYEWCHVGRRPDVARARESHTLQVASEQYKGERDRAGYLDDLQAKTKLLSVAAAEAMAGLCQGKLISANEATPAQQASDHLVEPLTVLRWIRGMFSSSSTSHHDTGRKALYALLKYNWSCARLLDEVLHQSFGEGEQFSLDSSFFGVVADILAEGQIPLPAEQIACLALSKLGHPGLDIRQRAFQLAVTLITDPPDQLDLAALLPGVGSGSANVYRHAQKAIAATLASLYPDMASMFLNECTTRLSQLEAPRRQATLNILSPWLELLPLGEGSEQALSNLMYLAIRFNTDHLDDIKELFTAFAKSATNVTPFVKFLFDQGGQRKSPDFVAHSQRVMAYLAQSPAAEILFDEICNFVEPDAMATVSEETSPHASLANLDALVPSGRSQTFSTGQLALLFAGELLPHRLSDFETIKRLPTLLHVALVHCDHASPAIREPCQAVLFQSLRAWIADFTNIDPQDASTTWTIAERKLTALAQTNDLFWKTDDRGGPHSAFLAPGQMTTLVMKILGILLPFQPRIRQQWGELALSWATSCPIRHLACRSFQVFRILTPHVSARMMSDTLARLSSTIASDSDEIQSFNQEVLRTFASVVQTIPETEIHNFPQIFWCATACLTTPYEDEFAEVIELLTHVLDKTNLSDPVVIDHLNKFKPADWVGNPPYLQASLLVGLRSSKTAMLTFDLIRRLTSSPNDDLIDKPSDRLLHGFIAALPWMLHSTDLGEPNEELAEMALDLAAIAETEGNAGFARLLTSFARVRFRSKDDFIRQASSLIRDYMSTHALDIVTLLLGFVLNTQDWMREKSMQVLKIILAFPEAKAPLASHEDLLLPLLKLVTTKHSAQALDVLDIPAITGAIPDLDSQEEIFGPISDSGWSVPNIEEIAAITRENLKAVFNTCTVETRQASAHFSVVQFADIKQFGPNPSFTSFDSGSGELEMSPVSPEHGDLSTVSLGELAGQLHDLNLFFDDGLDLEEPKRAFGHAQMPSDTVSERRVRAILARGKQSSITSPIKEEFARHAHSLSASSSEIDRHRNAASTSSLSLADPTFINNLPNRARGHYMNPSISSSVAASDFGDSQFKLEDDRAPSRNGFANANGNGIGTGDGEGTGSTSASAVSLRSLRTWNFASSSAGGQTPIAMGRFDRDRERERERTLTLGVLSGDESARTPSPRGELER